MPRGECSCRGFSYVAESGLPHAVLCNGWYTENYAAGIPAALQYGVVLVSAGNGRISSAARVDYAAAAAAVMLAGNQAGKIHELAGEHAFTLTDFAAEIARQSGQPVAYQNMAEADFVQALRGVGLPAGLATLLAESDTGASKGGLFGESRTLSRLIGRPTTPLAEVIRAGLSK